MVVLLRIIVRSSGLLVVLLKLGYDGVHHLFTPCLSRSVDVMHPQCQHLPLLPCAFEVCSDEIRVTFEWRGSVLLIEVGVLKLDLEIDRACAIAFDHVLERLLIERYEPGLPPCNLNDDLSLGSDLTTSTWQARGKTARLPVHQRHRMNEVWHSLTIEELLLHNWHGSRITILPTFTHSTRMLEVL